MHSDRSQEDRERTLAAFKVITFNVPDLIAPSQDGSIPVLVATDVASRGLDVKVHCLYLSILLLF